MDFSRFSEIAERDLSIKCPRTLGVTFAQIGSTVSIVTNTQLRKFGFSSLIKTPIGVIDCKVPQGKKEFNLKIFDSTDFNQYSFYISPLLAEDYSFSVARKLGPVKASVNFDSKTKQTNGIIGIENTSNGATFLVQGHYDTIFDRKKLSPRMFDEFLFKVHHNDEYGFAFRYQNIQELLEYSGIYSFGNISLGIVTAHQLKLSRKSIKFNGYPTNLRFLTMGDFKAANMKFAVLSDVFPNLSFSIRGEKELPNPVVSTRLSFLADFTQQEDGEFGVNLAGCANLKSERWGNLAFKAGTTGSIVCCADPSIFENTLLGHASISFVPNRKGLYQTSYSFNITCFSGLDHKAGSFFDTVSDYFSVIKSHFQVQPQQPQKFSFFRKSHL